MPMTITDALSIVDSAYTQIGGFFKPLTPGLGEACRVVAEGYRNAEKDIRDMLYESSLLTDDDLCVWCGQCYQGACFAQSCKDECRWRGPEPGGEGK